MIDSPKNLSQAQNRVMIYTLTAYLFAGGLACTMLFLMPFFPAIIVAPLTAFVVAWVLTKLVTKMVKVKCPACGSGELRESFTLQCRLPEYQCEQCQQSYVEGVQ